MRAILRVPRLSRLFHEGLREERLPEYEVLEQVYDAHYELAEEWLPADRYDSQEERAPFVGTKDGVARLDAARKLSLVEQHIVERNKGSPTRFDAAGITTSLDFHSAMSKQGYLRQAHQRLMTQALDLRPRNHDKYGKDAPQSSTDPVGAEFRSIQHQRLGARDGSLNGGQGTFQRYKIKFADNNIKISWKGKKSRNNKMKGAATGPGPYPEVGLPSRLYNTAQKTKGATARGLNLWQSLDRTNHGTSLGQENAAQLPASGTLPDPRDRRHANRHNASLNNTGGTTSRTGRTGGTTHDQGKEGAAASWMMHSIPDTSFAEETFLHDTCEYSLLPAVDRRESRQGERRSGPGATVRQPEPGSRFMNDVIHRSVDLQHTQISLDTGREAASYPTQQSSLLDDGTTQAATSRRDGLHNKLARLPI